MRELKRAKQMWIILFLEHFTSCHLSPLLRVLFLFWLQKYNPHFWLSTITSLKSTFIFFILVPFCCHLSPSSGTLIFLFRLRVIFFILVPKIYDPHFLSLSPPSRVLNFYFGSKKYNPYSVLSPFTSLKSTIFLF